MSDTVLGILCQARQVSLTEWFLGWWVFLRNGVKLQETETQPQGPDQIGIHVYLGSEKPEGKRWVQSLKKLHDCFQLLTLPLLACALIGEEGRGRSKRIPG